jgi:hypothetical protein
MQYYSNFVVVMLTPAGNPLADATFVYGQSLLASAHHPTPNPDLRRFDLAPLDGLYEVRVVWPKLACNPEDITPCFTIHFDGYVDNIVVPEPAAALIGWASVAPLAVLARRRARCSNSRGRSQTPRESSLDE